MHTDDRVKIWILPEQLLKLVIGGVARQEVVCWPPPQAYQIPADAEVVMVGHDYRRRAFLVMLRSREFAVVPRGEEVPIHPEPLEDWMFEFRKISETHERA